MSDDQLLQAIQQADGLRDRLVRAAYGLHFACESVALLLEHAAATKGGPPESSVPVNVEHWRDISDRAMRLVREWEHGEAQTSEPHDVIDLVSLESVDDPLLRELMLIDRILRADQTLFDTSVRARVVEMINAVDSLVNEVRRAITANRVLVDP